MKLAVDHVVVASRRLDEGVAWCEAMLGVKPGPGGKHVFMGTHNRLFRIASARFPQAYLEIIAIDPAAPAPARLRWFDLDSPAMQATLASGPRLVHWVARVDDIASTHAAAAAAGAACGEVLEAQRETAKGLLSWRITVRPDGCLLCGGAMPTLIEWRGSHPSDSMPHSGIELLALSVKGVPAGMLAGFPAGVGPSLTQASAPLSVTLDTPRGVVRLDAPEMAR